MGDIINNKNILRKVLHKALQQFENNTGVVITEIHTTWAERPERLDNNIINHIIDIQFEAR